MSAAISHAYLDVLGSLSHELSSDVHDAWNTVRQFDEVYVRRTASVVILLLPRAKVTMSAGLAHW